MGFAEQFIQGVQAGQQIKLRKQKEQDEQEDRQIEKMLLQHRLRELKISEKVRARTLAKENFDLQQGQPQANLPADITQTPELAGTPENMLSALTGMGQQPLPAPGPIPRQAMTIPGVSELGVGDTQVRPQSMEELLLAQKRAKAQEPYNLASGAIRVQDGEVVAENPRPAPPAPRVPLDQQLLDAINAGDTAKANNIRQVMRADQAPRAPEPLEAIIGDDGKSVLVPRSQAIGKTPATNRERTTEDERKSVGFFSQMRDAIATIDLLEDQLTDKEIFQIQSLPQEGLIGLANRGELSEPAKRYLRAFEQFTESRLRPVSGAAISDAEYARDRRTYAKQFKETPALNADRKRAREIQLQTLRSRAGVAMPKDDATGAGPKADPAGIR